MTVRQVVQCEVCKTRTLLRTLLGWLPKHPIRIPCGKCGVLIQGTATLDPPNFKFDFVNGKSIEGEESEYYLECSGELLTEKLSTRDAVSRESSMISPFIKAVMDMGQDNYQEFKAQTLRFLAAIEYGWPQVDRANQLWIGGQAKFLKREVHKFLPKDAFPMTNRLEQARGVHQLNLLFTLPIRDSALFDITTDFLGTEIAAFAPLPNFKLLVKHFGEHLLMDYSKRFHRTLQRFVGNFSFLIPALSLSFAPNVANTYPKQKGMTTTGFEDIKQFYIDAYEDALEILVLVVALNNLKHRGDFTRMKSVRRDVTTLSDFGGLTKGSRLPFFDGSEDFDRLAMALNSGIRNAIGHSSYVYDGATQLIRYYPKGKLGEGREETMYLVEFAQLCCNVFQTHILLNEVVYKIETIYRMIKGTKPTDPAVLIPAFEKWLK